MSALCPSSADLGRSGKNSGFGEYAAAFSRAAVAAGVRPFNLMGDRESAEWIALQADYQGGFEVQAILEARLAPQSFTGKRPAHAAIHLDPTLGEYCDERRISAEELYARLGGWVEGAVRDFPGAFPIVEVSVGGRTFCRTVEQWSGDREASLATSFCGMYPNTEGAAGRVECLGTVYRIADEIGSAHPSSRFPFTFSAASLRAGEQPLFPEGVSRAYTVPEHRLPDLKAAVRRMAKVAKKLGLGSEPDLAIHHETRRELVQRSETQIKDGGETLCTKHARAVVPVVDCTLTLPGAGLNAPGAWRVLAVVQPVVREGQDGHENEIFCRGDALSRVEHYRNHGPDCDHCHKQRARSRTLIIEERGSGRLMQVGVDCAALYVGDRVAQEVGSLEFQSYIFEVIRPYEDPGWEEEAVKRGDALLAWDSDEFVTHAVACIRSFGWQPLRSQEWPYHPNRDATANLVRARLTESWYEALGREAPAPYEITDADREQAAVILRWLDEQAPDPERDEYLANLQEMYAPGWISEKRLSFAVSVVRAHKRALEQREREAAAKVSRHVGTVGEQRELTLTLRGISEFDGFRGGTSHAIRFTDAEGNMFSWLTGSAPSDFKESRIGETFRVTGTVTQHENFRGALVTRLTRVKVMKEQVANAAGAPRRRKTQPRVVDHATEPCAEEGVTP